MLNSLENARRTLAAQQELVQLNARSTAARLALINFVRSSPNLEVLKVNDHFFTGFTRVVRLPEYGEFVLRLFVGVQHHTWSRVASENDPTDRPLTSIDDDRDLAFRLEFFDSNDAQLTTPLSQEGYTLYTYSVIHPIGTSDGRLAFSLRDSVEAKIANPARRDAYLPILAKFEDIVHLLQTQ